MMAGVKSNTDKFPTTGTRQYNRRLAPEYKQLNISQLFYQNCSNIAQTIILLLAQSKIRATETRDTAYCKNLVHATSGAIVFNKLTLNTAG